MPHPSTTPPHQFGEYTLVRRIGAGGQGEVYEARDAIGLTWALKIGHRVHADDERALARFTREAQWVNATFGALPRNCGILVGEHYGVFDQRFYVKMRLVEGESLAQRLRREGSLTTAVAVSLAGKLASIAEIAHANNAVHRDLKPENVLIERDGSLQVVDWGCIHLVEAGHFAQSAASPLCTLGYAAPEQYELKGAATVATDVYALGVMLFEMLTNYNPFLGTWRSEHARLAAINVTRTAQHSEAASPDPTGLYPTGVLPVARSAMSDAITRNTAGTEVIPLEERLADAVSAGGALSSWSVSSEVARPRSVQEVVGRQVSFNWKNAGEVAAGIPLALAELVEQMLQPRPDKRPTSMRVVVERLASIEKLLSQPQSSRGTEPSKRGGSLRAVTLVAAVTAMGAGGVAFAVWPGDEQPSAAIVQVSEQVASASATAPVLVPPVQTQNAPAAPPNPVVATSAAMPATVEFPVASLPAEQSGEVRKSKPHVGRPPKPQDASSPASTRPPSVIDGPYFGTR